MQVLYAVKLTKKRFAAHHTEQARNHRVWRWRCKYRTESLCSQEVDS